VFVSLIVPWKPILLVYPLTCGGDVTMVYVPSGVLRHALGGVMLRSELLGAWSSPPAWALLSGCILAIGILVWGLFVLRVGKGILAIGNWGICDPLCV
jgi:hypothetical protein